MPKAFREANRPQCPQRDAAIVLAPRQSASPKHLKDCRWISHWVSRALSEKSHGAHCRRWVSVEERVEPISEAPS